MSVDGDLIRVHRHGERLVEFRYGRATVQQDTFDWSNPFQALNYDD
jgi:hypothetical protein